MGGGPAALVANPDELVRKSMDMKVSKRSHAGALSVCLIEVTVVGEGNQDDVLISFGSSFDKVQV